MILDYTLSSDLTDLTDQLDKYTRIFKLMSKLIPHTCKRDLYFANVKSPHQATVSTIANFLKYYDEVWDSI